MKLFRVHAVRNDFDRPPEPSFDTQTYIAAYRDHLVCVPGRAETFEGIEMLLVVFERIVENNVIPEFPRNICQTRCISFTPGDRKIHDVVIIPDKINHESRDERKLMPSMMADLMDPDGGINPCPGGRVCATARDQRNLMPSFCERVRDTDGDALYAAGRPQRKHMRKRDFQAASFRYC
jgi:hypothetical protein